MNKFLVFSIVLILWFPGIAKRSAPENLSPVEYHNLEIIVLHFLPCLYSEFITSQIATKKEVETNSVKRLRSFELRPIYIAAKDTMSNVIVWLKLAYFIKYDNKLEQDVQDVFINKINIVNDDIYFENEANEKYKMNILSGKIKIISKNKSAKTIIPENLIEK